LDDDFKKLKQYKGRNGCTVPSWLRKVTSNFTLNYIKKQKKYKPTEDDTTDNVDVREGVSDPQQQPDEELLKKESEEMRKKLVKELIKDLNANDKLFLELSYGKKLPPGKIAEIFGITVDNVYSRRNRIIEKLKKTAKNENLLQDFLHLLQDN
jgi:RNA polymerase sigma factor (sigma-70 family)